MKIPSFSESAPASFPSRYTGLPLMPATTPVCSTFGPFNCTRMMDCLGPRKFGITPITSRSNFSTWSPAKIVYAYPCIPGRTWSTEIVWLVDGTCSCAAQLRTVHRTTAPSSSASSAIRWIRAKEWDERLAGNMKIDDTRQGTGAQSNPRHHPN